MGAWPTVPAFVHDALPGRVVFGVGAIRHLGEEVDRLGARAAAAATTAGPDCLVAMGGGSATGLAKAVALEHGVHFVAPAARRQVTRPAGVTELRVLLGDAWHGHRPPPR